MWADLLATLKAFSKALEKHTHRQGFKLEDEAITDLVDKAKRSHATGEPYDPNYAIYGSPYQQASNTEHLIHRYSLVSVILK